MYWTFRSFRLQSPSVASITWPVFFCDRTYRRGRSEERAPSVCTDMLASVGLRHRGCGLAVNGRPYRVRHPTDRSFTSWCSPPPLTRTQFRSVTAARPATDRDSHPADSIHSQSHSPPARAGGTAGRWAVQAPESPTLHRSRSDRATRPSRETNPLLACTQRPHTNASRRAAARSPHLSPATARGSGRGNGSRLPR